MLECLHFCSSGLVSLRLRLFMMDDMSWGWGVQWLPLGLMICVEKVTHWLLLDLFQAHKRFALCVVLSARADLRIGPEAACGTLIAM